MNKYLLTALLVLLPVVASAQLRVGVMNREAVISALPQTAEIDAQIQEFAQQRNQQYQTRYQEFVDDYANYQETEASLTEEQRTQRQQALIARDEELTELRSQLDSQIQTRINELLGPLMSDIDVAVESIAVEMELDFVFNEMTMEGDPLVYFSSDQVHNITDQVIETLTTN